MIKEFRLPDLGEGLTESEIVAWKVGVGDTVSLNQIIAEVETAKAVVELPSPFAGVITALHEQPGTVVEVGKPIVSFEVEGDDGAAAAADPGEGRGAKREPNLVGYGAVLESSGRPSRRVRSFAPVAVASAPAADRPAERPRSTPPVRKLAKDLGVNLEDITGTGEHGLITRTMSGTSSAAGICRSPPATLPAPPCRMRPGNPAHGKRGRRSRASASSRRPPWSPVLSRPRMSPSS